jgi:hypothetical protein
MTGHTADRERVWTDTQEWLDDLDSDGADADTAVSAVNLDGGERGGERTMKVTPPAANAADSGGDELAYHASEPDDRPVHIHGDPVDLDDPNPDPSGAGALDPAAGPTPSQPPSAGLASTKPPVGEAQPRTPVNDDSAATNPRYNKTIAVGFAVATAVATLVVSGVLVAMRSGTHTIAPDHATGPRTQISMIAAPTTTAAPAGDSDSTISYTASAVGCLPGSTAAQSVSGPDTTQAWVCVHGGNIGQYLVLNLGRTMVITAVSIAPGWVGADASGADQWQQHRVVTRVQWSFNDSPPTVVPQDTDSVHGDAAKPMPDHGVLASRIIMLVQETARAPADTAPTTNPAQPPGGLLEGVLGPPLTLDEQTPTSGIAAMPGLPGDQTHTDPADNTFAVSSIKIFGHPPQ